MPAPTAAAAASEGEVGGGGGDKGAPPKAQAMSKSAPPKPEPLADEKLDQGKAGNVITAQELAEKHRTDFKACIDPKHPKVTFTIKKPAKGQVSVTVTGDPSAKVKSCATAAAKKIDWLPGVSSQATLKFE